VDFGGERRVKRGEVRIVAGGAEHAGKPGPAIILQNDKFDATSSLIICP
jgi:mRNA interferase MazF